MRSSRVYTVFSTSLALAARHQFGNRKHRGSVDVDDEGRKIELQTRILPLFLALAR